MPNYPTSFPWAIELDYPAGPDPWAALPTKVAPPGDYFTPNTKPPAQNFNYILNKLQGADNSLIAWAGPIVAQNWGPFITAVAGLGFPGGSVIDAAYWDDTAGLWVLAIRDTTPSPHTVTLVRGTGSPGCVWTSLASLTAPTGGFPTSALIVSVTNDPSLPNVYYIGLIVLNSNTGLNDVYVLKLAAGAITTVLLVTATTTGFTDVKMSNFVNSVIAAIACFGTPAHSQLQVSTNHGGAWSMTTVSGVTGPWNIPTRFGTNWLATASTTAAPLSARSTNGTSFTFAGFSGLVSVGDVAEGLAFGLDSAGNTYFQMLLSGATTKCLESIDGIAWTDSGLSQTSPLQQLCAFGGFFVGLSTIAGPTNRIVMTTNPEGWLYGAHQTNFTAPLLSQSPNQLALTTPSGVQFSFCVGAFDLAAVT